MSVSLNPPSTRSRSASELILHAQLDDPASAASEDFARVRVGQAAIAGVRNRSRWRPKVEVVESVQKIGANLQAVAFLNRDGLLKSDVPVPRARPINRIPLGVTPLPGLRRSEGARIEPLHAAHYIMRRGLARIDRTAGD